MLKHLWDNKILNRLMNLLPLRRKWFLRNKRIMLNLMLRFMLIRTRVSRMNLVMLEIRQKLILLRWKNLLKYLSPKPMALAFLKG
jgi:hypothetical protein